jgi:hypothetical protein
MVAEEPALTPATPQQNFVKITLVAQLIAQEGYAVTIIAEEYAAAAPLVMHTTAIPLHAT